MSFFNELKRRNVFKVTIAYIVVAWLIAQVLQLIFESFGTPDWVMKTVLVLMAAGLAFATFFAWAFEMTPEGLKRESEVDHSKSITPQTGKKLNNLIVAVMALALAYFGYDKFILSAGRDAALVEATTQTISEQTATEKAPVQSDDSIAVLPFVNMSSDPEQEYFSDGISEEILNVLSRIPNLKVAARTSSFQFKGQNQDIANIARQLKVNHILEGSVRKAGNQLRITVQLIEAESGFHLWSDTYDRKLEDVFSIQDEIAGTIAGELRARLSNEPLAASQAVDLAAYELYLKGRGLVAGRQADELFEGIDVLKSAIEIEPSYASAMATLAKAYFVAPYFTQRYPTVEMRENALHWAEKSLEIEPNNAEALSVKAGAANSLGLDPEIALELLRKAVQFNPNNVAANNFLGDLLMRMGALEEAVIYESKASELDPLGPVHLADLGYVYLVMGDYERVIELSSRAFRLNTAYPHSHRGIIESYWALGDLEQLELAIHAFINSKDMSEVEQRELLSLVDLAKGDLEEARIKLLMNYRLAREGKIDVLGIASQAIQHGDFDIAGELLLMANANKDGSWIFPVYVRMPEQAPDSLPWQEFWNLPGPAKLAGIRRANGLNPHYPSFGEAAAP